MIRPSEEYLSADDRTNLFIRFWLPAKGVDRMVLCLHGMNSHSGYFARLGSSLAEKESAVYALDLRGNGLSGTPGDAESLHRQIADVGFVLKQLRSAYSGKPVYLLGHSLGAGYALRFAFLHPEVLDGLILLAPAVSTISAPSFRLILTMATIGFRILLTPRAHWDTTIGWSKALRESELGQRIISDSKAVKVFSYRYTAGLMQVGGKALLRYAASVSIPTLILQGERDGVVKPEGARLIYERLAAKEKQIMALLAADHDLFGLLLPSDSPLSEKTWEVVEMIQQWLTRVGA